MTRVAVIGTYNDTASRLFEVDLMRYLAAHGHPPSTVVFRTGSTPRHDVPLNTIHPIAKGRTVVQVTDFNDPAAISVLRQLGADLFVYTAIGKDQKVIPAVQLNTLLDEIPVLAGRPRQLDLHILPAGFARRLP